MAKLEKGFTLFLLLTCALAWGDSLPGRPKSSDHPGSDTYLYGVTKEVFQEKGRDVSVYLPDSSLLRAQQFPVVVFGASQASPEEAYEATFTQLAGKGVAVVFPDYANGFFDHNWMRMGEDYANLALAAVQRFPQLDPRAVVFSGHSKGASVASVAAGQQLGLRPAAVVLFQPAGYVPSLWSRVPSSVPVTVIHSDADTIIKKEDGERIYEASPALFKQFLYVRSYTTTEPQLSADHFFCLSKKTWLGGRDGLSPFHYYGVFGWLIGAAEDAALGTPARHPFLYGAEATKTGIRDFEHFVRRNWQE